ncbi:MAG: hypothetical protein ACOYOJ_15485, partial [Alsobacter sp.]
MPSTVPFIVASCFLFFSVDTALARMSNTQKCEIYKNNWHFILSKSDRSSMSQAFINGNENFIVSDCLDYSGVCPRNDYDIRIANMLTVAAMNNG